MKVINWIAYLFYRFFLVCGKDDWDAKYTAKLFTGVFMGFILIGIMELSICSVNPIYQEVYLTPFCCGILGLVILLFLLWYYWNKWDIRMKDITDTYSSWSKRKQKWMLAIPILADIASFAFGWIAYNIVKYYY